MLSRGRGGEKEGERQRGREGGGREGGGGLSKMFMKLQQLTLLSPSV